MEPNKGERITREILIRYKLVLKDNEDEQTPNFESYECCKESGICPVIFPVLYSRAEIEQLSTKLGYSLWDRVGNDPETHDWDNRLTHNVCKCKWKSFVVTRK
jgi:hypothetical protein